MNNDNFNNGLNESEEERISREEQEFVEGYFSIRDEMKKLEKEMDIHHAVKERFIKKMTMSLFILSVDFYPEYEPRFHSIKLDLHDTFDYFFDEASNLCHHHISGNAGYYGQLIVPRFTFSTGYDLFKDDTNYPLYNKMMELVMESFEKEYVDGFYHECYLKHIHQLLKKVTTKFMPDIYRLTASGFRELDGLLFIAVSDIFDIIVNANVEQVLLKPDL